MAADDSTIPLFKICTACKKEKVITQFGKQRLGKHGRRSICLACHNAAGRTWKANHTQRRNVVKRAWRKRKREQHTLAGTKPIRHITPAQRLSANTRRAQLRRNNPVHEKQLKARWKDTNPRAYQAMREREYLKNKDKYLARTRRFQHEHPDLVRLYGRIAAQRRRAAGVVLERVAVREALRETLDAYRIGSRYWDAYNGTLIEKPTVDHVVPLTQGGLTLADNLCVTSRATNASKGKKSLLVWLAWRLHQHR